MPSDSSKAAFGVFPQMRRTRSKQDREAAKDAPIALARGFASGVLGAPGDIESLIRLLPGLSEETILPTSEDVEKRLPLRSASQSPLGQAATGAGQLGGGFYVGPGSPIRAAAAVPGAVRRAGEDFVRAAGQTASYVRSPESAPTIAGIIAEAVAGRSSKKKALAQVQARFPDMDPEDMQAVENIYHMMKDPGDAMLRGEIAEQMVYPSTHVDPTPLTIMRNMVSPRGDNLMPPRYRETIPLSELKQSLRDVREASPELYDELKETARSMASDAGYVSNRPADRFMDGYAGGGAVDAKKFDSGGAAFGIYPRQRATPSSAATREMMAKDFPEFAYEMLVPQDAVDVGLMMLPMGGALRKAGAAVMAGGASMDAEAGLKRGVDLARRSLFGLKPSQEMAGRELTTVQRDLDRMQAELARAEKGTGKAAPKVEERSVEVDPGRGSAKVSETVRKVADTPVSRRTVLKSASGQVMQRALPGVGDIAKALDVPMPSVANVAESVAAPAANSASGLPGLIAAALESGMAPDDVIRMVLDTYGKRVTPDRAASVVDNIAAPHSLSFEEPVGAGRALMEMIGAQGSPIQNREALRYMQRVAPSKYDELRQTARDISEYGFE